MSNRIVAYSAAAALAGYALLAGSLFQTSGALAAEPASQAGSVYGAKTIGALSRETKGLAVDADAVRAQGGAATAWTVRWTGGPERQVGAVYGAGTVGALTRETQGLATSGQAVARQGGGVTANAARWTAGS